MSISKKRIIYFTGLILVGIFVLNLLTQPGADDLPGNFTELLSIRNENNTGPVHRRYAVSVSDTLWQEMEQYGNFMPYTKLGLTEVYFFHEDASLPQNLYLDAEALDKEMKAYCIAKYEKNAMGQIQVYRFPFQ